MAPTVVNICFALVRWTPVLFITAVIVWSYYAYVIQMCLFSISNIPEKVLYLFIYHPILFIFCWAYWQTIFTETGTVPKEFYLSRTELEQFENDENEESQKELLARLARRLPIQCTTSSGAVRYCEKCKCIKPDRAHHCSVCGKCNLKMDHHCPWVNNCVCFTNYKFFVLFLGYGLVYCAWIASTSIQYFIKFWTTHYALHHYVNIPGVSGSDRNLSNLHVVFLFFASIMFAISLLSLFCYHLFLVVSNRSTLETFRAPFFRGGPDKDGFSLGRKGNFIEVFGDSTAKWFLPLFTTFGDGVSYPSRINPTPGSYHSMDNTDLPLPPPSEEAPPPVEATPPKDATENGSAQLQSAEQLQSQLPSTEVKPSFGDGVNYPVRTIDEDYDTLLGQRQRWMEDGTAEEDNSPDEEGDTVPLVKSDFADHGYKPPASLVHSMNFSNDSYEALITAP